jgi:DNA-directed RNA polymerase subunit beta
MPPSIEGVVIGKKLFARAKKDKNSKLREKLALEKIEKVHQENLEKSMRILYSKLENLLKDKCLQVLPITMVKLCR